ncbi:MAG: M43 family zinc metalloprotease [Bacteroidales bacterium]|nr:M43 family zinc metalloprotease [Bacteroidales bacterium]
MIIFIAIFFYVSLIAIYNSFSQDIKRCYSTEINKYAESVNPEALKAKEYLTKFTKNFKEKYDSVLIIPVVFHVVHNYGPENISKEQILDAIRIINEDFRKLNADTVEIIPPFKPIAADSRIEFRLAKIDPNGNCTDGIDRVVSTLTYNANETTKLVAPSWDRKKYLNIWTVASIESGAAGYAYYPSSVAGQWGEAVDGVMILASYVGSIGTGDYVRARALTHEIGHYLNLIHPWGNSNTPGLPENCYDDDEVEDTPNTIGHTSCNLWAETCGSLDNVQNYMEYAYCDRMFTEGQKQRMRAALNSPISGRNNLWKYSNLLATGVADNFIPPMCPPIADFINNEKFGCDSLTVTFTNLTWHTDTISEYQWSFPNGTPSFSNEKNPIVKYYSSGIFSASLTAINPVGQSTITKDSIIQVLSVQDGYTIPFSESFENDNFPIMDNSKVWYISGNSQKKWKLTNETSASGNFSVFAPLDECADNEYIELYSPLIVFNTTPQNVFSFKYAYAQKDSTSHDRLQVYISTNCGKTWYLRFNKGGEVLQTTNGIYYNNFVPLPEHWKQVNIPIGSFISKPHIRIKFVATKNGNSNPIYIDDLNINSLNVVAENLNNEFLAQIYPNPQIADESNLYLFVMTSKYRIMKLQVLNMLGGKIFEKDLYINEGEHKINLSDQFRLEKGLYLLKLFDNETQYIEKFIKN